MEYIWIAKHRNIVANHTWDPREKNSNSCAHIAAPFAALHHFTAPSPPHLELELGELATGSETYFAEDVSGQRVPFLHLTQPPTPPSPMFRPRRKMLKLCGETQDRLAQELILFEFTIERDVIEPLYDLAEVNTPGCNHPISFNWCPDHLVQLPALQQPLSYMTFALLIESSWLSSLLLSGSCITLTFSALIHQSERQSPWEHRHSNNTGSVPCPVSHHHTDVALLCSSPRWKSQTSRNKGNI